MGFLKDGDCSQPIKVFSSSLHLFTSFISFRPNPGVTKNRAHTMMTDFLHKYTVQMTKSLICSLTHTGRVFKIAYFCT